MKHRLQGLELEYVIKYHSYDIGEGMAFLQMKDGGIAILNKASGVYRQFCNEETLLVTDDEIDYDAMERAFSYYKRPSKTLNFGGLRWFTNFKDGVFALSWQLFPDGIYIDDNNGNRIQVGTSDRAVCIINRNLDIIVPFQPMDDVKQMLQEAANTVQRVAVLS